MSKPRPTLAVIGAGKVGRAVGFALRAAGYPIGSVVCRTSAAAREACRFIGGGIPKSMRQLDRIAGDILLVSTPDSAIATVARRLAALDQEFDGRVALHASGSLDSRELSALKARGASVGSCHPLQSFTSAEFGVNLIGGSAFVIEGDREAVAVATRLARDAGGNPVRIRANRKPIYHAAAVMASGHVTTVIDASVEAMMAAGFGYAEALRNLLPLVAGTLSNIGRVGTRFAITGPFARGDEATIERNRAALAAENEELAEFYDAIGVRSRRMVRQRKRLTVEPPRPPSSRSRPRTRRAGNCR